MLNKYFHNCSCAFENSTPGIKLYLILYNRGPEGLSINNGLIFRTREQRSMKAHPYYRSARWEIAKSNTGLNIPL